HALAAECRDRARATRSGGDVPVDLQAGVQQAVDVHAPAHRYRGVLRALCAVGGAVGADAAAREVLHRSVRGLRRRLRQRGAEAGAGVRPGVGAAMPGVSEDVASDRDLQLRAGALGSCAWQWTCTAL